ncbi:MAG: 3-deoxy-manno-octulosonate cytidylyltransferase [Proteobacteria bacterium]|nr:3-deoxy-manno-octulosonate cytidylyltransferase [Pseudomonadota bacterium]MCP4921239.1 3-deoxy-manno-octulosonate cytidylyltransferase [Pseudomonadota bacterium]
MIVLAVIPSRYAANRLPGKPLVEIAGRPMIQHVWDRASASRADRVLVATDDARIHAAVRAFGGEVVMTSPEHRSGTDRVHEAATGSDADIVVNVQGDEPLLDTSLLDRLVEAFADGVDVVTAAAPLADPTSPHVVKVVCDDRGDALYFSRSAVPHGGPYLQHIGVYAYRRAALDRFVTTSPGVLERAERLEQLRVLESGGRIRVVLTEQAHPSVDTPADLARVRAHFEELT